MTKHQAWGVANVVKAATFTRFLAVRGAMKKWTFTTQKSNTLFGFCFLRSHAAKPKLAKFFNGFSGAGILAIVAQLFCVTFCQVLFLGKAFKVFNAIVCFVVVDVVDLLFGVKSAKPALRHNAMQKQPVTDGKITIFSFARCVRKMLFDNFSAARNGIKVVKESVFDSVNPSAQHAVLLCE